jgi:AraC-like DNA-binding protein
MEKSESLKIRLDTELLERLREQARENERTLAKEITYQLKNKEKENQKMEQLETYLNYCRDYITDRLEEHTGETLEDSQDLSFKITESDNISGSFTFSTYKAREYIKAWFFQAGAFMEDYADNFGEQLAHNPFTSPELFHSAMVIYGIEKLLNHIDTSDGEKITLDDETIKQITKRLQAVKHYDISIFEEN